jgi:Fic family protein
VQEWIDGLADEGALPRPTSVDFIVDVHRRFFAAMPEELRFAEQDGRRVEIVPGAFRSDEVLVGRHVPPSPPRIADFMAYYVRRYGQLTRGATGRILAIPAAHHRLSHIHPFLDGNGRVSRLVSHAMIRRAGIGAGGLWSISRGLARGLEDRGEYMRWMDAADMPRQGRPGRVRQPVHPVAGRLHGLVPDRDARPDPVHAGDARSRPAPPALPVAGA